MSRIRIDLPSQFEFSTSIPIRITDLNYGKHVGNDTILSLIHEARMQFLASFGYTEMEFEGASLIMSDVGIEFRTELFYGDTVTAFVKASHFSRASFDVYYKLLNGDTVVAIAKTGMVCYNYQLRKVVRVPAPAAEKMSARQ